MPKSANRFFLVLLFALPATVYSYQRRFADTVIKQTTDLSLRFQRFNTLIKDSSLVAAWNMDEGAGYRFKDLSGKNHTAYITGNNWNTTNSGLTEAFRRTGKRGDAVFLDGSQWLQVKDTTSLDAGNALSICMWYKPEGSASGTLISRHDNNGGFKVFINNGKLTFECYKNGQRLQLVGINPQPSQWAFLSITCASGEVKMYLDGKAIVMGENLRFPEPAKSDLFIGSDLGKKGTGFTGLLDEVCIYDKPLAIPEVARLYTVGLPVIYSQHSATIDPLTKTWGAAGGNQSVPHPNDSYTLLLLRFDGDLSTEDGRSPVSKVDQAFYPGKFGGSLLPSKPVTYTCSGLHRQSGSVELWTVIKALHPTSGSKTLIGLAGQDKAGITLYRAGNRYYAAVAHGSKTTVLSSPDLAFQENLLLHVAITWQRDRLQLWIQGCMVAEKEIELPVLSGKVEIGGSGNTLFPDYIDDLRISSIARTWGEVCPSGVIKSENASLDFRDDFNQVPNSPVYAWKPLNGKQWQYRNDVSAKLNGILSQQETSGRKVLIHPMAQGFASSVEAGLQFEKIQSGCAGVCAGVPDKQAGADGITWCLNSSTSTARLTILKKGVMVLQKAAAYDFPVKPNVRYTLTLSVYDDKICGFIDGNMLVAVKTEPTTTAGYGGLITENAAADFDDFHFTALTPSTSSSRMLQANIYAGSAKQKSMVSAQGFEFTSFAWQKRYGLLPWQRNAKEPEPPGNIFGPDTDVLRPNKSEAWRSEDSANSDLMLINGNIYYTMRGNPDMNGPHGPAALGMLTVSQKDFDGIHFNDLNAAGAKPGIGILGGHREVPSACLDAPPRNLRLQVNDQGMVYVDGKILVVAREFRNAVPGFPKFRRLTYGLFDLKAQKWINNEVDTVSWSAMDPTDCNSQLVGLNGTTDLFTTKDPTSGNTVILLYYEDKGKVMVRGLQLTSEGLVLEPKYSPKTLTLKGDGDRSYGQRIFFDNGIYYMHVNAGSDKSKLEKDWPDRFELYSSLDPYVSEWVGSEASINTTTPYFTRGQSNDPDNGAIWQGTMFKYRNRYYLYYENYHSTGNVDRPYDQYDKLHSGSRVGFATGN